MAGLSRFFTFSQSRGWAGAIWRGQPLRHDALEAELAGVPEHGGAVLVRVLVEEDAAGLTPEESRED
jgi:hypothetical protein